MKKIICSGLSVLFLLLFPSSWVLGAKKNFLPHSNAAKSSFRALQKHSAANLKHRLGLSARESLTLIRKTKGRAQRTHFRYQQRFDGLPIWGHHIIVTQDARQMMTKLHGTLVTEIENDAPLNRSLKMPYTAKEALAVMKVRHMQSRPEVKGAWRFDSESSRKMIYVDEFSNARVCYVISFFADIAEGGAPARPTIIMDAATGEIIKTFDALAYAAARGPGGNRKVGRYSYGEQFPFFEVSASGSECFMDTDKLTTWNMNHSGSAPVTHSFTCDENTFKEINGAYSPLNDAHYFGSITYDMFVDWFGSPPLPFKLVLGVHYGNQFENAFWGGDAAIFGDGAAYLHPLVGINVVAHEIAHGFTEQHSDLIYTGESGGINEAFSDMAGEAAEYYHGGSNDFLIGNDIVKGPGALRYMDDPPKDGLSIDSLNDYVDVLPVHFSSGLFNKAFYVLATKPGWNTRMAFEVFVKANQIYWEPSTGFIQGAYGAIDAAAALGYSILDVRDAFASVDIYLDVNIEPHADFEYSLNALTAAFSDTSSCEECSITSWQWDFGDGFGSTTQNPVHAYTAAGTYNVSLTITDNNGQTDTIAKTLSVSGFSADYCPAAGQTYHNQWIEQVQIGNVDRTSQASAYSNFTTDVIAATKASPLPVVLSHGPANSFYPKYWRVWADLNRDGDFDDSGEKLFEKTSTDSQVISGAITIPAGAAEGHTRLRVAQSISGYPAPCGTFIAGEVEDYTLAIESTAPTAAFEYTADGLAVAFADQTTPGNAAIVTWQWDFGDGSSDASKNPVHVYTADGTYTVSLTVTDGNGQTDSTSRTLSVSSPVPTGPTAAFDYEADALSVDFTDQSAPSNAGIVGWQWDFGDGQGATAPNPVHVYAADGTYTVSLTVTDDNGQTDSTSRTLSVSGETYEPTGPTAAFDYETDALSVNFTDQSTPGDAAIVGWQWDFGDGFGGTSQNPVHVYAADGTYTVSLTVTDSNGQTDSMSGVVSVSVEAPAKKGPNLAPILRLLMN